MKSAVLIATLMLIATAAAAQEDKIRLKDGAGKDTVMTNCGVCHSLDYIPMNSPFLDRPRWDATIKKMTGPYGATIDAGDAQVILDYLAKNYSG